MPEKPKETSLNKNDILAKFGDSKFETIEPKSENPAGIAENIRKQLKTL